METKANYVLIGAFTIVITVFGLLFALWAAKYSADKSFQQYYVVFNEPVTTASAQTVGNYSINNGVSVSGAVLGADTRTVTLTTSTLGGGNYTLTVNNVTDRATPPNTIVGNSQGGFSFTADPPPPPSGSGVTFQGSASGVDTDGNSSGSLVFGQGALSEGYVVVGVSMYDPVVSAAINSSSSPSMIRSIL